MNTLKDEALSALTVAAAHHTEMAELASAQSDMDFADALLDAGDVLDVAIVLAFIEGSSLFELWSACKLDVGYLAALTEGKL